MSQLNLASFARHEFIPTPTPLEFLPRFSSVLGRDVYIKRDDLTPLALGGNKLRKLEFLAADALAQKADTLVTAGAIQSNHVRQTAAVASKLGLKCVALLENPINTQAENYLTNGNRLLLDFFNTEVVLCDELSAPDQQLAELADELRKRGARPYVIPIGGSNVLGALGYVKCAQEIEQQARSQQVDFAAVVVASGSAGTHAGLAVGLETLLPNVQLIGVTVSRKAADQHGKVHALRQETAALLNARVQANIELWDEYFSPSYGTPNESGQEAVHTLAALEGILLDPVYTGKTMAGLIDGIKRQRFNRDGAILFVHTGGSPALFAYHPQV
ncbi:D-cysteine desulfhydrase [Klebsiella pneumoniae]|uniref:D-cysteine desulfhydrase n=1 Tax=Klebsiella pneumoniae TaxID=573 RepID=UPI004036B7BF